MAPPPAAPGLPEPVRRALAIGGSPLAIASLAAPPLAALGWVLLTGGDAGALLDARTFRAWSAALALALLCAGLLAGLERRWPEVAIAAGLLALSAQPEVTRLWRFEGAASVGEGEESPRWRRATGGPLAARPELGVVELDPGSSAVTLRAGGEGIRLLPGRSGSLRGATVTLREVGAAPSFRIRAPDGAVVEEGLVELSEREQGFIEVPSLPHRLYFEVPPRTAGAGASGAVPAELRLRIQRGKLRVMDALLEPGVEGTFEGLRISWDEGARWALLEVRRAPTPYVALAGLALVAEGALAAWLLRRRT